MSHHCAKMDMVISQVVFFLDLHINVGDAMLHNHLKSSSSNRKGIHVSNGSATFIRKSLLPDHAVVTHEITCQGRDHIVNIQSGESVLVVINEHFEPDLILRNLRERLRRIAFHWPRYPEGFGMIIVDFNSSGSGTKPSQKVMQENGSVPHLSHMLLKLRNQTLQGRIPPPMVRYAPYPELTERSSMCPWLRHVISTATLM